MCGTVSVFSTNNANIEFNNQESYGVEYDLPSKYLAMDIQEHRELVKQYLAGDSLVKEKIIKV